MESITDCGCYLAGIGYLQFTDKCQSTRVTHRARNKSWAYFWFESDCCRFRCRATWSSGWWWWWGGQSFKQFSIAISKRIPFNCFKVEYAILSNLQRQDSKKRARRTFNVFNCGSLCMKTSPSSFKSHWFFYVENNFI